MDKQEVKRSSKTRLWLSARRKKKGPARHKKENINPNSTLGTGEHASEQSDSDNNTDPPPQPLNLSSTLGTGEHASEQSDSDNNTDPPPQFQNFSSYVDNNYYADYDYDYDQSPELYVPSDDVEQITQVQEPDTVAETQDPQNFCKNNLIVINR
ncbi:uncharacterized protein [Choristoneura fumiferana]|uniref:uncharacterized protein n=1 Tax=Choristoneura fumiferana TaxID=7141 RepID=UPI003D156EA4